MVILMLWGLLGLGQAARPARAELPSDAINQYITEFNNAGWEARSSAFYELLRLGVGDRSYVARPVRDIIERASPADADKLKLALIQLLEKENQVVEGYKRTGGHFGEDYSNYYGDVIAAVTALRDPRSMNAMLGALDTGGMAVETLASFAPASLGPLLSRLRDQDSTTRMFVLETLCQMLAPENYDKVKAQRLEIKRAFLDAVRDPAPVVRSIGARGLGLLGDPDSIPILRDLAEHDPAYLPEKADTGGYLYLVRPEAKKALTAILAKQEAR
jgi:hypothetical protein